MLSEPQLRWRRNNPDKIKEAQRRYRLKHTDEQKEYRKAYYKAHLEQVRVYNEKVVECDCGAKVRLKNKVRHQRSLKHRCYLKGCEESYTSMKGEGIVSKFKGLVLHHTTHS